MPDIRLYQNASLSSPVDADIIFSANSQSSPQWIETKTTMSQLASYISSKVTGGVTVNTVFISPKGNDTTGNGSLASPFATRAKALTYIGSSATTSNPYVILYDAGSYSSLTFHIYPNIFDMALMSGSVFYTITTGAVTQDTSWDGVTGNYILQGITFDSLTQLNLNFTSFSLTTANLYINNNTFPVASAINGLGNTVNFNAQGNTFSNLLTLTAIHSLNLSDNNNFNGLDFESAFSSTGLHAGIVSNNISLGDVTVHTQSGADTSIAFRQSPATSYTLTQENKSTIEVSMDNNSYRTPTISGSGVSVTKLSPSYALKMPVTNTVFVATNGDDTNGLGTPTDPFATRSRALTYIGSSATLTNPYVILYEAGSYTESTFPIYPNIYDTALTPNSVIMNVTNATISADSSWTGKTATSYLYGMKFDSITELVTNFSSMTGANVTFIVDKCSIYGASAVTGSSTVPVNLTVSGCYFSVDLLVNSVSNSNIVNGNYFGSAFTVTPITSGSYSSFISNNEWLASCTLGADPIGTQTVKIYTSPCSSMTLDQGGTGSLSVTIDSASYINPTITGTPTITKVTQGEGVLAGYSPTNYTATDTSVTGNFHGIDNYLSAFSGTHNAAYLTNNSGSGSLQGNAVLGSTATVYGKNAGANLNSGSTNNITAIGEEAGATVASAPANAGNSTFIGYQSGKLYTTSGSANDGHVAVGYQSLATTSTSAGNTAVGYQALQLLTTSNNNTALGWGAGVQLTSGTGQNVFVGVFAGSGGIGQTLANNVMIGYHAGWNASSAHNNVTIGSSVAPTLGTGTNNIVIGDGADVSASNATNQIVIGQGVTGLGNNIVVIGNSSVSNLVNASTSGGCALGSIANPFGFLYLGTAANYVAIDTGTQTTNGQTVVIPDTGGQPQNFALTSTTAATTSQTMVKWFRYFANSGSLVTFTLPATIAQGDVFEIIGQGTGGWKIVYGTGVSIKLNANLSTTTTTGSLSSTDQYDSIKLVAQSSTVLVPEFVKGNLITDTNAIFNSINTVSPVSTVFFNTTSKTLAFSDAGTFQNCSNASTQTITVPPSSSVAWLLGTQIQFFQQNTGQVVFSAGAGVTIQSKASNLKLSAQYSGATLTYLGSNVWSLIGDLTA